MAAAETHKQETYIMGDQIFSWHTTSCSYLSQLWNQEVSIIVIARARFRLTISEWFIWVEQLFSMTGKEQVTGKQCPFCFKKFSPQGWHTHVATHTMHAHLNADAISIPKKKRDAMAKSKPLVLLTENRSFTEHPP